MRKRILIIVSALAIIVAIAVVVASFWPSNVTRIPPSALTPIAASEALDGSASLVSVGNGKYRINFTLRNKSRKPVSLDVCFSQPLIYVEVMDDDRWQVLCFPGSAGSALKLVSDWPLWEYYELYPGESVLSEMIFVPGSREQSFIDEGAPMAVCVGFDGGSVHGGMRIPFSTRPNGSEDTSVGEVQYTEKFHDLWDITSPLNGSAGAEEEIYLPSRSLPEIAFMQDETVIPEKDHVIRLRPKPFGIVLWLKEDDGVCVYARLDSQVYDALEAGKYPAQIPQLEIPMGGAEKPSNPEKSITIAMDDTPNGWEYSSKYGHSFDSVSRDGETWKCVRTIEKLSHKFAENRFRSIPVEELNGKTLYLVFMQHEWREGELVPAAWDYVKVEFQMASVPSQNSSEDME